MNIVWLNMKLYVIYESCNDLDVFSVFILLTIISSRRCKESLKFQKEIQSSSCCGWYVFFVLLLSMTVKKSTKMHVQSYCYVH